MTGKKASMSLNKKLDEILENQRQILKNENKILTEEGKIEELENEEIDTEEDNQKTEEDALKELEKLELSFKKSLDNPIRKITRRDFIKGFIGAFIGVVSHFTFSKAFDMGDSLQGYFQATILYLVSFMIISIMLYYTGFRKIEKHVIMKFMPLRAFVLYFVSLITVVVVYMIFGEIHFPIGVEKLYNTVGAAMIIAVIGAGTADLIGRGE